jgi:hypothetical protein
MVSLAVATGLSLLWTSFFIFYCMHLVGIYQVAMIQGNPLLPITVLFPAVVFVIFVLFTLGQFIKTRRGALTFVITLAKIVLSPFGLYEMMFGIVWATEQLLSLVMIFYDIAYSFCFYAKMLTTPEQKQCGSFMMMVEILCTIVFGFQLLQSIRVGVRKRVFWGTREMLRAIRALLYIIVIGLSMSSTAANLVIFGFWIVFTIFCGIYSFMIDVFLDWSLFFIKRDESGKVIIVRR